MKKHTVLFDLSIAMNNGYCGIAKESRLVFKALSGIETLDIDGLLVYPKGMRYLLTSFLASKKGLLHATDATLKETIWHSTFAKTLDETARSSILGCDFFSTNLNTLQIKINAYLNRRMRLNTTGYDVAFFAEPTQLSVSPNTIKIVRYHDAIPLTHPDLGSRFATRRQRNMLKRCIKDAYFVCNSEPTREALLQLYPKLEKRSSVIPCLMTENFKHLADVNTLKHIILSRLSSHAISPENLLKVRAKIHANPIGAYLFNLSALEPRKNHAALIRAWEILRLKHADCPKLIVAGNKSWHADDIYAMMRPHILAGNLIHLENLSQNEISMLYTQAKAFISPSFAEGFGLPPIEAMQCECPTIVSDIPTHRWVMGDASLYCDPSQPLSLADAIERLLYAPDADVLRRELISRGLKQAEKYSENVLRDQWRELFERCHSEERFSRRGIS